MKRGYLYIKQQRFFSSERAPCGIQPGETVPKLDLLPMYIISSEEQSLLDRVKYMAKIGYGYSKARIFLLSGSREISGQT